MVPSTAFAITLAATNVLQNDSRQGKVLLLQDEMCSAVYAWERVCQQSHGNITLDIIPYPTADGGWTKAVLEHLDDNVIVACLPQIHWSDGAVLDLEAIGHVCREKKTMLIVDATQSIGIMPFDVNAIQPTLVACSVHKWLRGPIGLSLVYVASNVQDSWGPLDQHGRSRAIAIDNESSWDASKNEMGPNGYPDDFCKDARKFDSGGKPNPILLPMIRAALEQVVQLNVSQAQDDLKHLTKPIINWALRNGFALTPGPHAGHLIGIRPAPGNQLTPSQMIQIASQLQSERIFIAVRCGAFRISPYIDTDSSDIQRLLGALNRYCK
jgi:selenocysteine lyase/cysteine desulfurase